MLRVMYSACECDGSGLQVFEVPVRELSALVEKDKNAFFLSIREHIQSDPRSADPEGPVTFRR